MKHKSRSKSRKCRKRQKGGNLSQLSIRIQKIYAEIEKNSFAIEVLQDKNEVLQQVLKNENDLFLKLAKSNPDSLRNFNKTRKDF